MVGAVVQFELHDGAKLGRFRAVHGQHESLFQERLLDRREIVIKRHDPGLARLLRITDHLLKHEPRVLACFKEYLSEASKGLDHDGEREL